MHSENCQTTIKIPAITGDNGDPLQYYCCISRNITSMVKSNGTLVKKEDISKETNFEVLSNGTTFLNF